MQILTSNGYKHVENLDTTDELLAYDINTGDLMFNHLISKTKWTHDMFPPTYYYDETGSITNVVSSEEVFNELYGGWNFYRINNTWTLFALESVWANMNIVHAYELKVGDIVYDENDNDVIITDIQPISSPEWWRLKITGDHSYIADGLTLHNPTRYWVGGGSSTAWNATGNTNWSSTSGGANNASVPTGSDDVIFDGSGSNAQSNSNISATQSITSLLVTSAYSGSISHSAALNIAGNITLGANQGITGSVGNTISLTSTSTIATNGIRIPTDLAFTTTATSKSISGSDCVLFPGRIVINVANCNLQPVNTTTPERLITRGINLAQNMGLSSSVEVVLSGGNISNASGFQGSLTVSGSISVDNFVPLGRFGAAQSTPMRFTWISGSLGGTPRVIISELGQIIFDTKTSVWGRFDVNTGLIATLTHSFVSPLTSSGDYLTGQNRMLFSGSAGFQIANFIHNIASPGELRLTPGNVYRITNSIQSSRSQNLSTTNAGTIRSAIPGTLATFILEPTASCQSDLNYIDIDASRGRTINTFLATVTNSINVRPYNDIPTVANSSVG